MRYLILGLGIYGSNLARDLTDMGHEVIGVDNSQANIEAIKDYISTVYLMDVTEEGALALLPINNVDLVIVTIGENFGASVKVVAMLKKMKVKHIFARAIDQLHESILQGFQIDRILTPEQRAARDLTFEMALDQHVQTLNVDEDHYVLKFAAPQQLVGLKYADVNFKKTYLLTLITATRSEYKSNIMGIRQPVPRMLDLSKPDLMIEAGDVLTVLGSRQAYFAFFHMLHGSND